MTCWQLNCIIKCAHQSILIITFKVQPVLKIYPSCPMWNVNENIKRMEVALFLHLLPYKNLWGWASKTEKRGKNYRFLVNFAPTDSLDISTYYDKVHIDLLMANIRKADFSASLMVNAAWCVVVQQYVIWIGICYVNRKEISKIIFKPNFFEIGLFGLLHSKWANHSDSAQLLSRQIHKTLNGLNPSSHFRARLSAILSLDPICAKFDKFFGPLESPYGENWWACPPGPWWQYPSSPEGWGVKMQVMLLNQALWKILTVWRQCATMAPSPGPLFTKKTPSYQYRDSHYKPERVVRPS